MSINLSRPLVALAVGGALALGGAVFPTPASAAPPAAAPGDAQAGDSRGSSLDVHKLLPGLVDAPTEPVPNPTESTPVPDPTESTPVPDPTTSAPVPDPTTSAPVPDPTTSAPVPDPVPDTVPPTGRFTLSANALWVGQQVILTQGVITDDVSGPTEITRTVDWGDGTSSPVAADQASISKQYTSNAQRRITLTLTDAAGNSSKADVANAMVVVTTPGAFKLSKHSVWNGEIFKVTISKVPAGTKRLSVNWGDGYVDEVRPANQTISGVYYHRRNGGLMKGAVVIRATFVNQNGASSAIWVGKVTIKKDSWKPVVKVKKPAAANRLKSWKVVRGTVSDKGSGTPYVYVWVTRITGNKVYCFNAKKKWKRVYSEDQYNAVCTSVVLRPAKGKWSLKVAGLKKGTVYVDARTWDWADHASNWSSVKAKVTRS